MLRRQHVIPNVRRVMECCEVCHPNCRPLPFYLAVLNRRSACMIQKCCGACMSVGAFIFYCARWLRWQWPCGATYLYTWRARRILLFEKADALPASVRTARLQRNSNLHRKLGGRASRALVHGCCQGPLPQGLRLYMFARAPADTCNTAQHTTRTRVHRALCSTLATVVR